MAKIFKKVDIKTSRMERLNILIIYYDTHADFSHEEVASAFSRELSEDPIEGTSFDSDVLEALQSDYDVLSELYKLQKKYKDQ